MGACCMGAMQVAVASESLQGPSALDSVCGSLLAANTLQEQAFSGLSRVLLMADNLCEEHCRFCTHRVPRRQ